MCVCGLVIANSVPLFLNDKQQHIAGQLRWAGSEGGEERGSVLNRSLYSKAVIVTINNIHSFL